MHKKFSVLFLFFLVVFFLCGEGRAKKTDLPERYKIWLEEEVVYITAPVEKEVFLKLKTDRERDLFIEAFWKHRDPTPGTPENEFKKEHYSRIRYVSHFFGRHAPMPGWRTDRGRMYIILGEPNDIQRFEGKTQVYPTEIWFYQGKTNLGLPPGFNIVFFKEGGIGEYKLYSPLQDGPQALMTSHFGDPLDYLRAFEQLREFEPDLAEVSLNLIPGERPLAGGRPSMSSDILIQRIETTPVRQIKEKYAKKFLEYKDSVGVEYSTNYIDSDSLIKIVKDPSGIYFVNYAVEPEILSVNLYENKYYTTLKLNGKVSDMQGKTIHQFEKNISLEFNEEQMKQISHKPFSILDMFPLIPGNFRMSILLKNEISKEFTSVERNILIPSERDALQMTSLFLGYKMKENKTSQSRLRPFQIGRRQIYFQANRVFLREDDLIVAFQIHGLDQALRGRSELRYVIFKDEKDFYTTVKKIDEYSSIPNFVENFSLKEFLPAHYRIRVSLFIDGQEVLSDTEEFDVTHVAFIARPWIYTKFLPGTDDPVYDYLIGIQLFNSGKTTEASVRLEKAYRRKPESIDFALSLARARMALSEFREIESVLLPFLNETQPPKYEAFFIMGRAYQNLGRLSEAIQLFDKAISHYGINTNILNAVGECYFQLKRFEEALAVWEKSLEINPDQPQVKKNVEALKEKK
ncbi:MAG: GWxTD domain-containing protein [Acidobacteriota bacterium]|nr:GWxTD domain-containing protein [Acidobacteriota bacterium]